MKVSEVLSILPEGILEDLALETGVNNYSKKLQGEVLFKLLLHCILTHKENSLRSMESAYESLCFNILQPDAAKNKIRYSSISERLSTIDYSYFEKLFYTCVDLFGKVIGEESATLTRFDSTIVATSGKLLKTGYRTENSSKHLNQLKFTIGFSEIPTSADVYLDLKYASENLALRESILSHHPSNTHSIRCFDRGLTARLAFEEFTDKKIPFITRLNIYSKLDHQSENIIKEPVETKTLIIYSDTWVYLYSEKKGKGKIPFRCIKAEQKNDQQPIWFVSNIPELSAVEITTVYKQRWDIETFFKFLKQELNFSHLINRSENGVKVILYVTLIASILLLVYKKTNKLTGFKIMKQKFVQDLEKLLVIDIVFICGGDTGKANQMLFNSS